MRKLEALADSIVNFSGAQDPSSAAYQARNPGALKAFSPKHSKDKTGLRVFKSWLDGYQALLFDLQIKCAGKSTFKQISAASNLSQLSVSMGMSASTGRYLAKFLRQALADEAITEATPISYFHEAQ